MPDLLLELFSEEIPARMQGKAADDLKKMVTDRLVDAGLVYEGARAFATPRRLALYVQGVPARQPDLKEERKGPRVGAPEGAIAGFLKAAGLSSISEATIQKDPKKGDFYIALAEKPGRPALDVIGEFLTIVLRTFPWPKSMRWGAQSAKGSSLEWVRPLHAIVATFGPETEAPEVVRVSIDGVSAGNTTFGHRFLSPGAITVSHFDDYVASLEKAKVVLDAARRREIILSDAKNLAFAQGFELVEDEGLLNEVAGLVEWPVVLMGAFDESFLKIPDEVIRATIRNNQKCFVLRDPKSGRLANRFILTANTEASDGGKVIIAGNERVIRARLSDAKFFYETDLKIRLEDRLPRFRKIVFHERLGSQADRIQRIERLAGELAPLVGADVEKVKRAARLAKTDLLTEVVGEFPETQGLMGKYYALAQGEDASVAVAIEEHYKPAGPNDRLPSDSISIAVAIADRIDMLAGFWAINEKPTGSKDPYALRRAALGVIRLILELKLRIKLSEAFTLAATAQLDFVGASEFYYYLRSESPANLENEGRRYLDQQVRELKFYDYDGLYQKAIDGLIAYIAQARFVTSSDVEFLKLTAPKFEKFYLDQYASAGSSEEAKETTLALASNVDRLVQRIKELRKFEEALSEQEREKFFTLDMYRGGKFPKKKFPEMATYQAAQAADLLSFFVDRLKVQLREQGARHDLVDAVFALEGQDDFLLVVRRVEALGQFLDTEDGRNLLGSTKRATNIIEIEEKRDSTKYIGKPNSKLYQQREERLLARAINKTKRDATSAIRTEDFAEAMGALAKLRPAVDAFFDEVTVNVDDKAVRENRLKLLNEIREATRAVADFSKIEG